MIARFRALVERRVPQFLAIYLGVCWGIIEFVSFAEGRYGLSPHWTDLALIGFTLLIPSVLLVTYHHGRPGRDELVRAEKIGIPLNALLVAVVLFLGFSDKELGAVTTSVTVQDESGRTIERAVPKASFRQRLALFNFDGDASDTAVAWLRYGLPTAIATDLAQDMFLDVRPSPYFRAKLRQLGFQEEVGVPLSLKRQIAEEQHLPHFVTGTVTRNGPEISVQLGLYEVGSGTLVEERVLQGTDLFLLVDEVSSALKDALDIPSTAAVRDLPISEVLTASAPAFRDYVEGAAALQVRDDWVGATALMERAVAADPTFTAAHLALHNIYLLSNQAQRSMAPLQKAMDHLYRLPERMQYDVKAEYYFMKQERDKAFAVAKLKVDLFPEDISGYALLSQFQMLQNDRDGMIASLQKIIELDPAQHERLRELGGLYEAKGDFDRALEYYSQYAERFPSMHESFLSLAKLHRARGDHPQARANYERALLIAPGEIPAIVGLAALQRDLGEFDAALRQYEEALAAASSAEERAAALGGLADYFRFRGELRRSLEYAEQALVEEAKFQPPFLAAAQRLGLTTTYVRAGRTDEARRALAQVAEEIQPPFDFVALLGWVELHLELEQPDSAEKAVAGVDQAIETYYPLLKPRATLARGRIAELRGQCAAAIALYEEKLAIDPTDAGVHTNIARCHRALGQPRASIESALRTLRIVPFHPQANYEIALAYLENGDRANALEHLRRTVQVWRDADPSYTNASEAKARLRTLESAAS
jgi:tetratricopeptide (TPR) repeat protein